MVGFLDCFSHTTMLTMPTTLQIEAHLILMKSPWENVDLTWLILEPRLLRSYFFEGKVQKVKGSKSSFVWTNSTCVTSACQHLKTKVFLYGVFLLLSWEQGYLQLISPNASIQRAGWGAHQRHGRLQVFYICCLTL